ncbi:hypothetical protein [Flagellimonas meridianipacifica]|uniref:hypothetical protein n=1 Tax=Flagellimonas meridianipacifica TaxID=1080225 RepID=UPI0011B22A4C|nr:hypothetical protein [Allomuricauda pacifica]
MNSIIREDELGIDDFKIPLTKNTKFILQADLRQNYFHSIETFFEFFFAFLPRDGKIPDNRNVLRALVKSNWRKNYKKIEYIANGKFKMSLLDQIVQFLDYEVSIGQYLFYLGTFSKEKFDDAYQAKVQESIESIKKIIKILAIDFSKRDEYNAYKHTMRVFPNFSSIHFLDAESLKEQITFDLSNSASYQLYDDNEKETIVKTTLFDPERDYKMTKLCSRLIHNMIELRSAVFRDRKATGKNEKLAVVLFNQENIEESIKHNVEIQDLSFSSKLIKGNG